MRLGRSTKRHAVAGPLWAADGGNGRVVGMTTSEATGARELLTLLLMEVPDLFPTVPAWLLEVLSVQYTATLIELEAHSTSNHL